MNLDNWTDTGLNGAHGQNQSQTYLGLRRNGYYKHEI